MTRSHIVVPLGLGCAPLGNLFTEVSEQTAIATVDAAWDAGIRRFDTAPLYGFGLSEHRLGLALHDRPRGEFTVSTKVGRVLVTRGGDAASDHPFAAVPDLRPQFDFSRDGVLRSLDASCSRLGLDHVDTVYIHDPDDHMDQARDGAFPALAELRAAGVVNRIGAGMNDAGLLSQLVEDCDLDTVLIAGRYSLLDQSAIDTLFPVCLPRGVTVTVGGVFNSGILANRGGTFDYQPAPPDVRDRVRHLRRVCDSFGIELATAALAFPATHPAVDSVLFGARSASEVAENANRMAEAIDPDLWDVLSDAGLLDARCLQG